MDEERERLKAQRLRLWGRDALPVEVRMGLRRRASAETETAESWQVGWGPMDTIRAAAEAVGGRLVGERRLAQGDGGETLFDVVCRVRGSTDIPALVTALEAGGWRVDGQTSRVPHLEEPVGGWARMRADVFREEELDADELRALRQFEWSLGSVSREIVASAACLVCGRLAGPTSEGWMFWRVPAGMSQMLVDGPAVHGPAAVAYCPEHVPEEHDLLRQLAGLSTHEEARGAKRSPHPLHSGGRQAQYLSIYADSMRPGSLVRCVVPPGMKPDYIQTSAEVQEEQATRMGDDLLERLRDDGWERVHTMHGFVKSVFPEGDRAADTSRFSRRFVWMAFRRVG